MYVCLLPISTHSKGTINHNVSLLLSDVLCGSTDNELLEVDEDKVEVESVTEEWVEDMQRKIQSSMSDIQGCIVHLHQLCGLLFDLDTKKKKKKEGGIVKLCSGTTPATSCLFVSVCSVLNISLRFPM